MSNEELNRKISELKELNPAWVKTGTGGQELILSVGRAWVIPERCILPTGQSDNCNHHKPRNWTGDEAANAELRDELPADTTFKKCEALWAIFMPHVNVMADLDWIQQEFKFLVAYTWLKWKSQ